MARFIVLRWHVDAGNLCLQLGGSPELVARQSQVSARMVTLDDLQRYMNGLTGQSDGVYGVVWRRPDQRPLGPSAAGNVASVVKAYYLGLPASER
jgi:hypothetical protein